MDRAPLLHRILATLSLTVILTALLVNHQTPFSMDFLSFWAAGKLASTGQAASAYDLVVHHATQLAAVPVDAKLPFGYPPFFLFALVPIGVLPATFAAPFWVCATLIVYFFAVKRLVPDHAVIAIAFPPVVICAIAGQNALLTASLFVAAMAFLPGRPGLAGIMLGCMAIKPQLGVVIPLALLAGREYRAFMAAGCTVLGLTLASLVVFGSESWQGFFAQSQLMSRIVTENLVGWQKMASVYAGLCVAGVADWAAWSLHGACALAGAISVWQVWRRSDDALMRAAILAPATLLASPYLYIYDQCILVVTLIWLVKHRVSPSLIATLALLPAAQSLQFGGVTSPINLAPLLTLSLLLLVRHQISGATDDLRASTENSFSAV